MKTKINTMLACLLVSVAISRAVEVGEVQITFKVVDDSGKPVPGATVGMSLIQLKNPLGQRVLENATKTQLNSITDKEGGAVIKNSSISPEVYYGVPPMPGYYYTRASEFKFRRVENNQWQPWNPTVTIVLKPIINPIPMYAKETLNLTIPENVKPVGYDLQMGDWVTPYGKGLTSDFNFNLERQFTSVTQVFSATLTLTFSNDGDGIQTIPPEASTGSDLRSPRFAPENGYESKLVERTYRESERKPIVKEPKAGQKYFFRVRTKKDDQGKIVSALYGKIYGDINFDFFSPKTIVAFTYYLNPDRNSRNMEFDPKQNLFKNLPLLEQVSAP